MDKEKKKIEIKAMTPKEVIATTDDIEYLAGSLFPRKYVSFIFGEAGVGKTWLLLNIAISLAKGLKVLGQFSCKPIKVLVFEGDAPNDLIKQRLLLLDAEDVEGLHIINRFDNEKISLSSEEGLELIKEAIDKYKPDLVIFDSLISFSDFEESNQEQMKSIIDPLRIMANDKNIHVLIVHHARKRTSQEKRISLDQSDMIGSSALSRLASSVISVYKREDYSENHKSLLIENVKNWGQSFEKINAVIVGNEEAVFIEYKPFDNTPKPKSKVEFVISYILEMKPNNKFTKGDILKLDIAGKDTIERAIKKLISNKEIKAIGKTNDTYYIRINNQENLYFSQEIEGFDSAEEASGELVKSGEQFSCLEISPETQSCEYLSITTRETESSPEKIADSEEDILRDASEETKLKIQMVQDEFPGATLEKKEE